MHDPDRLLLIGTTGRAHGVAGALKVVPVTDDPDRFRGLKRVFIGPRPETATEYPLAGVRFQYPKGRTVVLLTLTGVAGRDAADALRGLPVYAHDTDLPPLDEGEVFLHDLIGFTVEEADADGQPTGRTLGMVRDLFDGAQLLFAVARDNGPDVLLPDVEEFVLETDVSGRRLLVRPPEGLFDDADAATERDVPDTAEGGGEANSDELAADEDA